MGKRSEFKRRERDYYPTPFDAVKPLAGHLPQSFTFCEPCAGDGRLASHIEKWKPKSDAVFLMDIEPQEPWISQGNALDINKPGEFDYFITNPPWPQTRGEPTVSLAKHLSSMASTWLLLSADFAHNAYFSALASACVKIVSVGRVSWMENGTAGKDNCAWYLFDQKHIGPTQFFGKEAKR